ncbi:amino acid ABC transporter substrate-binding protein [Aquabacterium sp. CECT 9606]|uniref:amino acid ABC transporter substrate-binding protein n=1 Tax=Aquabacterium sp. CECT 9606 TaxID=2845822 RepID=UPI001E642D29|nr:amino acid ABC transporter substrate-binding protein [Aquabacterium sp. CECT 9606]CAH0352872.1 Putative amino-acid ABC transporter-binding protein YhdW [Aquabacterium sp. CECT 9606]
MRWMTWNRFGRAAGTTALLALLSTPAWSGATLDAIRERGQVKCGVSTGVAGFSAPDSKGRWTGLDVDVCRALAAAVLGDSNKVNFVPLNSQQRFTSLQSGQVDLLSRNTSWTLTRDASLGFHFTAVTYYDGQGFLVPKKLKVSSAKQLRNAQVCIQSGTTTEKNLSDFSRSQGVPFKPVVYDSFEAAFKAFFSGRCQAYTTDASGLAIVRNKEAPHPEDYVILPELISKEPLGPLVRRGDDEWFAIVKWTVFAMIEAEELGLTQANIDSFRASPSPSIQRLVGTGEDMGKLLGLDKTWSYRIVKAVGNYGEVYERNVGAGSMLKLPRGPNRLWSQGGLMYAPPVR